HFSHLRVCGAHNCAHVAVGASHALLSPLVDLLAHQLVERTSVDELVLELPAGRIGCLHKDEKSLLLFLAHVDKGLHTVGSKVGVDSHKVLVEWSKCIASHLHFSDVSCGVGCGSGADVPSLDIADHNQAFFFTVVHSLFESCKSRDTELLVHG